MPPGWAIWLISAAAAIVLAVIGTIGWLDEKYATKGELALVARDVQGIAKVEAKVDSALEKLTSLRVSLARALGERLED